MTNIGQTNKKRNQIDIEECVKKEVGYNIDLDVISQSPIKTLILDS